MSMYSRWQKLDVVETVRGFVYETMDDPWSRGGVVVLLQVCYWLGLWVTVRILRMYNYECDE